MSNLFTPLTQSVTVTQDSARQAVALLGQSAIMDKLGNKLLGWLDLFEAVAKQYAPDVVQAALGVVRVSCFNQLLQGWAQVLFGFGLFWWGWRKFRTVMESVDKGQDGMAIYLFLKLAAICVGALLAGLKVATVLDAWLYLGLFEPKLYLARLAMAKVLTLPGM